LRCSTIHGAGETILADELGNGKILVFDSDERLLPVLATLEECRAGLARNGNPETAHLVAVAILDLRMRLNRITDAELKALCDEMTPPDGRVETSAAKASAAPAGQIIANCRFLNVEPGQR
jgi:hypothetical protein